MNIEAYKGVIFDMDGVIIDSEPVYMHKQEIFMRMKNFDIRNNVLYKLVGKSRRESFKLLQSQIPNFYQDENIYLHEYQDFWKDFNVNYKRIENVGIRESLNFCKCNGLKIALASSSSKETIIRVLNELELFNFFDVIVSGDDFKESKPNPEIYIDTLKKMNLKNSECFAIEDSTVGIQAAKGAGLFVIAKEDNRFGFDQSSADHIIYDINLKAVFIDK